MAALHRLEYACIIWAEKGRILKSCAGLYDYEFVGRLLHLFQMITLEELSAVSVKVHQIMHLLATFNEHF